MILIWRLFKCSSILCSGMGQRIDKQVGNQPHTTLDILDVPDSIEKEDVSDRCLGCLDRFVIWKFQRCSLQNLPKASFKAKNSK